jgi:crotonobetainyl-CoA:carnitine CoA-transferase CaiB-like acyl-CoA transferase
MRDRLANRAALTEALDAALAARDSAEWVALLGGAVPVAPVLDIGGALDNPFVAERGGVADAPRADGGAPVPLLTGPVRVNGAAGRHRAAPGLGADTEAVLARRLGLDRDVIGALKQGGTIK